MTTTTVRRLGLRIGLGFVAFIVLLAALFGIGMATGVVKVYNGLNGGVLVANSFGYEWKGYPGFFRCDGQC